MSAQLPPGEGYTTFAVRSSRSRDYQTEQVELTYELGRPVHYADLVQQLADAQKLAAECAEQALQAALDEKAQAQAGQVAAASQALQQHAGATPIPTNPAAGSPQPAAPTGAAAPAPAPAFPQPGGVAAPVAPADGGAFGNGLPKVRGSKPQNKGTFDYVPTSSMPANVFVGKVADGVRAAGYDPDHFTIFDNRARAEQGEPQWGVGRVVASQGGPWEAAMGNGTAFYIDFQDSGELTARPTKDLEKAAQMMRAMQQQYQG